MQQAILGKRTKSSIVTGIFFITATVSAIIGFKLYDPILNDSDYLVAGAKNANQILAGAFFEVILSCANIGTAIMLYPRLKKYNESIGMGYVCFRFLEVVFITIGVISMLSILTVSKMVVAGDIDTVSAKVTGETLKAVYGWAFLLGPNFILGINTFLYSYTFYKCGLVSKWLAIWGMAGAVLIFIAGILLMFGTITLSSAIHLLMALPIATFEMVLAGQLIAKGYRL